jgi:uncharacterized phage protein (TIGR02218 family)
MSLSALDIHLQTGATTVARAWSITRRDGLQLGFTDHDLPLAFDGLIFRPQTGMTARALTQSSGLAVDNSEALGVLSDARISEADINAGLYDGADVTIWLVNWQDVTARKVLFKGHLGEIRRSGIGFEAELRGLTEALNQPQGRVFQSQCAAVLGNAACGLDLTDPAFASQRAIEVITDRQRLQWSDFSGYDSGWFTGGRLQVLDGAGRSLSAWIKADYEQGGARVMDLWEPLRAEVRTGDQVLLQAGCDKTSATCAEKFNNIVNFQGFPDVPGEDWFISVPASSGQNDGGALS